ncbi:deoxyhypusine synthase [Candidatus Woesearchaeota archaeon]|nr:deoxyhypusine synthase [Candidatus Woesearchaeota archaeon]
MDKKFHLDAVKDIDIENASILNIAEQMHDAGGFSAKKFGVGVKILAEFIQKKDCLKFLSIPAAPISTGLRGVIKHMVKKKMFDVIVTTCGFLDHDVARTYKDYYKGDFMMDDAMLNKKGINRLGSILVPNESYGIIIEDVFKIFLQKMYDKGYRAISTKDFCYELGKCMETAKKRDCSILYWAYKNKIPIFIPAPTDGSVGSQVWMFNQKHKDFTFDIIKDEHALSDLVFEAKSMAALIIGGGVSKHHVIWWSQFNKGLDYAVYITTAVEYDGSLSGAQTREAISWGKLKEKAKHVTIEADATLILPFMIAAVEEKLKKIK